MIRKKRLPRAGERVRVGRRLITVPGVPSTTDPNPVAPTRQAGDGDPERPTDELSEELIRMMKAATMHGEGPGWFGDRITLAKSPPIGLGL